VSGGEQGLPGTDIFSPGRDCRYLQRNKNYTFLGTQYPAKKPLSTGSGLPVFSPLFMMESHQIVDLETERTPFVMCKKQIVQQELIAERDSMANKLH